MTVPRFLTLIGVLLVPAGPGAAQEPALESRVHHFRITRIVVAAGDSLTVLVDGGADHGLFAGARGEALGVYSDRDSVFKTRGADFLGTATVTTVEPARAKVTVRVADTTRAVSRLYVGDIVALPVRIPKLARRTVLSDFVRLDIVFTNNARQDLFERLPILRGDGDSLEQAVLQAMVEDIHTTARTVRETMLRDNPAWNTPQPAGRFRGIGMVDAMDRTTVADVRSFLRFVSSFPGKYMGHTWRIDETYATWIINRAPLGRDELRDSLLAATSDADLQRLLTENAREIRDGTFTDSWNTEAAGWAEEGRIEEARRLNQVALAAAARLASPARRAWGLFARAQILEDEDRWEEAIASYREARDLFDQAGDAKGSAYATNNIGRAYNQLSRYEEALAAFDSSYRQKLAILRTDSSDNLRENTARSLLGKGSALERLGRLDEAAAALREAEALMAGTNTSSAPASRASLLHQLGRVFGKQAARDSAMAYYRRSRELYRDLGNREGEADQLDEIGYQLSRLGRCAEAIPVYEEAWALHLDAKNPREAGFSRSSVGQCWWQLGDYDKAIAAHQDAVRLREEASDRSGMAYSLSKLAGLYRQSGDPTRAMEYYARAEAIYGEVGDRSGQAEVLNSLGDTYYNEKAWARALEYYHRARAIREEIKARQDLAATLIDIGDAWYGLKRYDSAGVAYEQGLALYREVGDRAGQVTALTDLGLIQQVFTRDHRTALRLSAEALALARQEGDSTSQVAFAYARLGRLHDILGAYDSALVNRERALAIYQALGEKANQVDEIVAIGHLLVARGDFAAGRDRFTRAAALAEEATYRSGFAEAQRGLGTALREVGEYARALEAEERSLAVSQDVNNPFGIANAWIGLGNTWNDLGEYEKAVGYYTRADSVYQALEEPEARATPINNMGTIYFWQGDYARAREQFERTLAILGAARIEDEFLAIAQSNLGEVFYEQGDYAEARRWLDLGLATARRVGVAPTAVSVLTIQGKVALAQGRLDDAARALDEAWATASRLGARDNQAEVALVRGRLARERGDLAAAAGALEESIGLSRAIGSTKFLWEALYQQGLVQRDRGDTTAARRLLEESIEVLERIRGKVVGGEEARKLFASGEVKGRIYEALIALLIRAGQADLALEYVERSLNDDLRGKFGGLQIQFADEAQTRALAEEQARKARLDGLDAQLARERAVPDSLQNREKIAALEQTRSVAENEYIGFVNEMVASQPELRNHVRVNPRDLRSTKRTLPPDVAVAAYLQGEAQLYIFVATADTVVAKVVEVGRAEMARRVQALLRLARNPATPMGEPQRGLGAGTREAGGDVRSASARLYAALVAPIEAEIRDRPRLAVVPSGDLHYLPFQLLGRMEADSFRFLAQERTVFYITELQVEAEVAGPRVQPAIMAFGNADNSLPSAEQEVEGLRRLFPATRAYLRQEATEARAKNVPASFNVLHFATHGTLDYTNFKNSFLTLAGTPDEGEDGRLTLEEVWGMSALDQRQLVVLSACNTAVSQEAVEGWPNSPATAFLDGGVPTVIASLWPVDDAATADLVSRFYRNLLTMDKAGALREAQLAVRANPRHAHPYYWAAWVLVGDYR